MRRPVLLLVVALLAISTPAAAQWRQWAAGADYDPGIPDPETWLGRSFAVQSMTVDEIRGYLEVLAEASPRVELELMGVSVQGDPLLLAVIAEPGARQGLEGRGERIEAIRDAWSGNRGEREALAREERSICWIGCSVHGDEASGSDAGVLLAWHLAADRSPRTAALLAHAAVIVDPCQNPDGRRRFLQQVRSYGRQRMDPDSSPWAAEHWSTWPGGRTNHFLFDLNRDWAFLTQTESRARAEAFLRWRPQVFVDLHEMSRQSTYFFPPPTDPINPHIPESQLEWFEIFGRENARVFDERSFEYFVGESFDLFYPGFGDSWPTLQGAIGMTYEQASTRGRLMRRLDGTVAGYPAAVEHHFVAALATVQTTADNSDALLQSLVALGETIRERAEADPRKEIVIPVAKHRAEADRLAEILSRQGIRVWRTLDDATASLSPLSTDAGRGADVVLPAGSLRIPLEQPAYALARSLLDHNTPMGDAFIAEEEARMERGLNSRFYDVTAWSLILSYGLEAFSSDRRLQISSEMVETDAAEAPVVVADAAVAWLIPCRDNSIYAALTILWSEDVAVRCALEGVGAGNTLLPRGTLVVGQAANRGRSDLVEILSRVATETRAEVIALDESYTEAGPSLGSDSVIRALEPRIGLLSGPGVSPLSAGALTWLFEERYGLEFTVLLREALDDIAVEEFDVLVVPELIRGTDLPLKRLDGWVREGGVLVAIGSASLALIEDDSDSEEVWTTVERVADLAELGDEDGRLGNFEVGVPPSSDDQGGILPPERRPLRVPGAIFRVELDSTHYLTLGKGNSIAVPVLSDRILTPSVAGRTVGRVDADDPLIAGFTWPVMEEALKGQAWLVEERRGKGRVILFAEDPSFRGVWEGLHGLLLNAVLIAPSVGN
jgi:hypothetical protein